MSQRSFYNSRAWKDTRTRYKQSVGGLCERCLAKGIYTPADVVHHKTPINDKNVHDLSISLGWDNLAGFGIGIGSGRRSCGYGRYHVKGVE